jgi:NAD dependent epimerase/dehydratase family enzyme
MQAYNLAAPQAQTQMQWTRAAAAVLRRPVWSRVPAWLVRLLLGEQATLLLDGARVMPARLQAQGYVFRYPKLRGALENLLNKEKRP